MPLNNPEPADQSRWVNISLEQNLSLISSRLAADIARENVRVAFGGHLPTLDLVAGRSYSYTSSDQIFDGTPFSNVDSKVNDRQIGLQFTLPIYSGGFTQSKVRQAQYQWIAAKEGVVQSSRATERQARDAYLGVISGIARVQALRQAVESNRTALKATEAGYEVGTRTSVDVLNARRLLVQAETDYATARYDYIVSVLQLRLAAGNLDRTQLVDLNNWLTLTAPTSPAVATPETISPTISPPPATPPQPPPAPTTPKKR
jgi:outer membrane protein